jgi:Protein of unknown function (DUF2934)
MKNLLPAAPASRKPWPEPPADMHAAIGRRAEEIYARNGKASGHDLQNWIQAEAEIFHESVRVPTKRAAIVIKVNGIQYVGEYDAISAAGYAPEFAAGEPVPVRFDGNKMFILRANRTELETDIVKKLS